MSRWIHEWRRLLGRVVATVRLNHVTATVDAKTEPPGRIVFSKRRRPMAWLLIAIGNRYLAWSGCLSEVLPVTRWSEWECRLANAYPPSSLHESCGVTLHQILTSPASSENEKLRAFELSVVELRNIHQRTVELPGRSDWPLSHGDATSKNIAVSLATNTASWFDFDTRHRLEIKAETRFCDDLRALLFSSATQFHEDRYAELVERSLGIFGEHAERFQSLIDTDWATASLFHLAQAPLTFDAYERLRHAIRIWEQRRQVEEAKWCSE